MKKLTQQLIQDISQTRKEPDWLLAWRIDAFKKWQKMTEPHWAEIDYDTIDYDSLNYYNEQKQLDNSELKSTYEFLYTNVLHSKKIYDSNNINEVINEYDIFITGSDQVWNFDGFVESFFLPFVDGKEPQTCRRNIVKFRISMGHQLITLLGGCI